VDATSNSIRLIVRFGFVALALLGMLSVGGGFCAHTVSASECCTSSGPKSPHRNPIRCCKAQFGQTTAEVSRTIESAPDRFPVAALNPSAFSLPKAELRTLVLTKIHPPPGLNLSPEHLCSLQI